ncbi:PHB depolymerase family esterase [bacterium]|nr:PHB depolymerase family esterase [bacterium]
MFVFPAKSALVYTPANLDREKASLVVVLHGCLQSAESMAFGTGWNQVADKNNLVLLYPQVPIKTNWLGCWNWFLPENQKRDSGELKLVMSEIDQVLSEKSLHHASIYLVGISSGGATVASLLACYPERFKAGAIHSGISYGLAQTLFQGDQVLKHGPPKILPKRDCDPKAFKGSLLVIQGDEDTKVSPSNAPFIFKDFFEKDSPISSKETPFEDMSVVTSEYLSKEEGRARLVVVRSLGHAWSGFLENLRFREILDPKGKVSTQVPYFARKGPSATNLIWDFFQEKD